MALSDWLFDFDDDSLPLRIKRFLQFGVSSGLFGDLFVRRNVTGVVQFLRREGFSTTEIHALHAAATPNRLALVDDHRSLTYRLADREINRIAHGLSSICDLERGDFGMIMLENRIEYVVSWFALIRLGASAVHASHEMKPDEVRYQLDHSESRLIFASDSSLESVRSVAEGRDDLRVVTVGADPINDNEVAYRSLLEGQAVEPSTGGNDETPTRNVIYTSGTTGKPKGTVRKYGDEGGGSTLSTLIPRINLRAGDRGLVPSPIYHGWGQGSLMIHTFLGSTVYLRPTFDAKDTLKAFWRWNINSVFLVPIMIRRILNLPDELHERWQPESLRSIVVSGAPFPQPLKRRAVDQFGPGTVHEVYAASELGAVTHLTGHEMLEHPGSSGEVLPGLDLMIADEEGQPLPRGEVGSIYVKHEGTMEGYLKDEEATREITHGDWITLDDLGYLDEDGHLHITGRSRDMVITGGVNVYPVEIEEVLEEHPSVDQMAVFGVPDEEWGERLVAATVPANGASWDPDELEEFAREHLHPAKVPKEWHAVEELPSTSTGKILKRKLEERFGSSHP